MEEKIITKILETKCNSIRTLIKVHQNLYWMVKKSGEKNVNEEIEQKNTFSK